jgi:hypothetical protein
VLRLKRYSEELRYQGNRPGNSQNHDDAKGDVENQIMPIFSIKKCLGDAVSTVDRCGIDTGSK